MKREWVFGKTRDFRLQASVSRGNQHVKKNYIYVYFLIFMNFHWTFDVKSNQEPKLAFLRHGSLTGLM